MAITADLMLAAAKKLIEQKRYTPARRELQQILAQEPHHVEAKCLLWTLEARELRAAGKTVDAMAPYQQILELDETHEEAVLMVRTGR